jgi:hypothetical protein
VPGGDAKVHPVETGARDQFGFEQASDVRNGSKADLPRPKQGSIGRYPEDEQLSAAYLSLPMSGGFVDLNYLFHRQQVERTRSEMAESAEARAAHEELAKRYEERIETVTSDDYWFPKEA